METYNSIEVTMQLVKDGKISQEIAETIFPELKESEDERIRKELIQYLKDYPNLPNGNYCRDDFFAWLEKQESEPNWCHHKVDLSNCSEEYRKAYYDGWNNCNMQHSQCESEKSDVLKCLINGMKFYYEDNKEATWGTEKFSMKVKDILSWLERQGEQNPTDKVEPKFHLGDWIIHQGTENIYQVVAIIDNQYQLKYGDNYTIQKCVDVDRCARLWDISKDAKEPYVISTNKELLSLEHEVIGWLEVYKQFAAKDDIQYIQDCIEKIRSIQLPQWNPDDKKMEKIKQKNAWSEKDDINLGKAIWYVENPAPTVVKDSMLVEWLKSLKERCTWKPSDEQKPTLPDFEQQEGVAGRDYIPVDWVEAIENYGKWKIVRVNEQKPVSSKDDERNLKGIIDEIEANKNNAPDCDLATYDRFLSWLKSLSSQNRWKPSDVQIECLSDAIKHYNSLGYPATKLKELLDDLKKLKEK